MLPSLTPGQIVVGTGLFAVLHPGDVIIFEHDGLDKIKRIDDVSADSIFVVGDNPSESTDSRTFGSIPRESVVARVIWPHTKKAR